MDPNQQELMRRIEIAEGRLIPGPFGDGELHDPLEDEEPTAALIKQVGEQASLEVDYRGIGRCHAVWGRMREILKAQHGVVWYSPAEMNPRTMFD